MNHVEGFAFPDPAGPAGGFAFGGGIGTLTFVGWVDHGETFAFADVVSTVGGLAFTGGVRAFVGGVDHVAFAGADEGAGSVWLCGRGNPVDGAG